jgi:hypothetical protein
MAYWRTNLTLRRLAPLFGVSKFAADRIIGHLGPLLAHRPRRRFRKDTVLTVDGTLVPTRPTGAAKAKNSPAGSRNTTSCTNESAPVSSTPSPA